MALPTEIACGRHQQRAPCRWTPSPTATVRPGSTPSCSARYPSGASFPASAGSRRSRRSRRRGSGPPRPVPTMRRSASDRPPGGDREAGLEAVSAAREVRRAIPERPSPGPPARGPIRRTAPATPDASSPPITTSVPSAPTTASGATSTGRAASVPATDAIGPARVEHQAHVAGVRSAAISSCRAPSSSPVRVSSTSATSIQGVRCEWVSPLRRSAPYRYPSGDGANTLIADRWVT